MECRKALENVCFLLLDLTVCWIQLRQIICLNSLPYFLIGCSTVLHLISTHTRSELERDRRWSGFNDCSLHKISSTPFQGLSICHRKTCPTDVAFNIKVIYSQNEFSLHTPIFLSCPFSKSFLPFFLSYSHTIFFLPCSVVSLIWCLQLSDFIFWLFPIVILTSFLLITTN